MILLLALSNSTTIITIYIIHIVNLYNILGEEDMRFVYCACAISALLNDWTGIDKELTYGFIISCITYEGGFALIPSIIIYIVILICINI